MGCFFAHCYKHTPHIGDNAQMIAIFALIDHLRRQKLCALRVAVIALASASVAGTVLVMMS